MDNFINSVETNVLAGMSTNRTSLNFYVHTGKTNKNQPPTWATFIANGWTRAGGYLRKTVNGVTISMLCNQ